MEAEGGKNSTVNCRDTEFQQTDSSSMTKINITGSLGERIWGNYHVTEMADYISFD